MNIAFDIQPLEGPEASRGIGKYTRNLLAALLDLDGCPYLTLIGKGTEPPESLYPLIQAGKCSYKPLPLTYPVSEYLAYSSLCPLDVDFFRNFDILHVTSPLMPDTLIPCFAPCSLVATLFDLIPLIMKKELNINIFSEPLYQQYIKRIKTITHYDRLLSISQKTADDVRRFLDVSEEQIATIFTGVDEIFYEVMNEDDMQKHIKKWGLTRNSYIFTVGGFNVRKNMEAHFKTFRSLIERPPSHNLKLVVTCRLSPEELSTWQSMLQQMGIHKNVILTNEVSDIELKSLYHGAAAFLFLSMFEGFGLPVAEACVCSTPVVASDIPTNREILGDTFPFLVKPDDVELAASFLRDILTTPLPPEIEDVYKKVRDRCKWSNVAQRCLQEYRNVSKGTIPESIAAKAASTKKPRVGIVAPLFSSVSGIADYINELVPYLAEEMEIVLFSDEPFPASSLIMEKEGERKPLPSFPARYIHHFIKSGDLDILNYHLGNNITHAYGYFNLRFFKGIVTLHDLLISPFIFEMSRDISPMIIKWELEGLTNNKFSDDLFSEFLSRWHLDSSLPLLRNIKENAYAIIVHNQWMKQQLEKLLGNSRPDIHVIPMGINIPGDISPEAKDNIRKQMHLNKETFVVISFGNITPNKRLNKAIEAFAWFHKIYRDSVFIVVGKFIEEDHRKYIQNICAFYNVDDAVRFAGYITSAKLIEYLAIADLGINLRYPSFGETSASLLRALAMGIPCLISDTNQYREFPDTCTFKIPPDQSNEADLIINYLLYFAADREVLSHVSIAARKYVCENHTLSSAAQKYAEILSLKDYAAKE